MINSTKKQSVNVSGAKAPVVNPKKLPAKKLKTYILVAEDDKFYANIYQARLTKEGYQVLVVNDGVAALKAARERKPDLLLLDLVMPIKDGFDVLREMKADPKLKSIKVVVLTNLGQEDDVIKVQKLGAADYLIKTNLSIQEMMEKIKGHLS